MKLLINYFLICMVFTIPQFVSGNSLASDNNHLVRDLYEQSMYYPTTLNLAIEEDRHQFDTGFYQCLDKVKSWSISASQNWQSHCSQMPTEVNPYCFAHNYGLGVFHWVSDIHNVISGSVSWQQTRTGQVAIASIQQCNLIKNLVGGVTGGFLGMADCEKSQKFVMNYIVGPYLICE